MKEHIIVVEFAPGQLLLFVRGRSCDSYNMQVVTEANCLARSFKALNKLSPGISGIDAQNDPA